MMKKRRVTDRMNNMENNEWKWTSKTYRINYNWDSNAYHKLWQALEQEKSNTQEVIDHELMAMDLLECLVEDSANKDAVTMLAAIGIQS